MASTTRTLQQLADQGKLRNRDIDIIMVAAGFLSYEVVEEYLAHRDGQAASAPESLPRRTVPEVAQEITERICGCQYQDGGSTRLVSANERDIYMQVEGACVFCPQIRYTIDILKQAIRFRVPEVEDIVIDGTRFEEKTELPVNNQLTMSLRQRRGAHRRDEARGPPAPLADRARPLSSKRRSGAGLLRRSVLLKRPGASLLWSRTFAKRPGASLPWSRAFAKRPGAGVLWSRTFAKRPGAGLLWSSAEAGRIEKCLLRSSAEAGRIEKRLLRSRRRAGRIEKCLLRSSAEAGRIEKRLLRSRRRAGRPGRGVLRSRRWAGQPGRGVLRSRRWAGQPGRGVLQSTRWAGRPGSKTRHEHLAAHPRETEVTQRARGRGLVRLV